MSWIDQLATFGAAATGVVGIVSAIAASRIARGDGQPGRGFLEMVASVVAAVRRRRRP